MTRALYSYFGSLSDHDMDLPGHPLYQMFFINSLAKRFNIKKFDVMFYNEHEEGEPMFCVARAKRDEIYKTKIRRYNVSTDDIRYSDYNSAFLKYRFRNYSRLREGSFDRLAFDNLAKEFEPAKTYIVDTDGKVKEPYKNIVSLFEKDYLYPTGTENVFKVLPILKEDMLEVAMAEQKTPHQMTFIGNQYFKDGLGDIMHFLSEEYPKLDKHVQGKWDKSDDYTIIDRRSKCTGYNMLAGSACSLHMSKRDYYDYSFMSPRIFESLLLGTIIFAREAFMPQFSRFEDGVELVEKMKFLSEITTAEYQEILLKEINELYSNLGEMSWL